MKKFEEKKFNIPELKGLSKKSIEEHLKLYSGYVKNANLILEKVEELKKDSEKNAYALGEIMRRFGFEYNGMRNHEIYFASFEGGGKASAPGSALQKQFEADFGGPQVWFAEFSNLALTRGIGWAILYYDRKDKRLLNAWIDEQHLGQLQDCAPILALDMWEHSFVFDYQPSGKKAYVQDFFGNINWETIAGNFTNAAK
jgi:Fe-Mn family superoxide dismutase